MGHQLYDGHCDGKFDKGCVESDHVVDDCEKDKGEKEEDWELGELSADEVGVRPIHPVEVLSQENWQFEAEHVDHCKHVGESHISDQKEEDAIDVHDPLPLSILFSRELLAKVDCTQDQSDELKENNEIINSGDAYN